MKSTGAEERTRAREGYLYHTYGDERYLRHALASVVSLRRHDRTRPVALAACEEHLQRLRKTELSGHFDELIVLNPKHCSITGFKHNLHLYMPFERTLFLDCDLIWCKDPAPLWTSLSVYPFTITGLEVSDNFFGASKQAGIVADMALQRRKRTMQRFGLTYLSRIQSGMIYAADRELTRTVCQQAIDYFQRREETHFQSRLNESGRNDESCEWNIAMAMSRLELSVYPWLLGEKSPQLDFIDRYTEWDREFRSVSCLYYGDRFVYSLRGLRANWFRKLLLGLFSLIPGKTDHRWVTPYSVHFGWLDQKRHLDRFADSNWQQLLQEAASRPSRESVQ